MQPTASSKMVESSASKFPIVGIGASAGGLAAFEAFFSGMPAEAAPGLAFVLVQHLAPDHKSILTELVQRYTSMKVTEVTDGMVLQPNCVYIIPPNHDLAVRASKLQLLEPAAPRGHRLPIDFFFRSLAQDQHERAICVVLSGTGSDGALGIKAIKDEGGLVLAQNPASAEFDGMPRSALATGLVDYELKPAEMATQIMTYVSHAFDKSLLISKLDRGLKGIYSLLLAQTGHDFSQYKPRTILRRIERRMAVHQTQNLEDYVKYLQQTSTEVQLLFRDLLIGVTNFFRDPEAFRALEEQFTPQLFEGKPPGSVIRVWTAGCSTGEEAYSIAILLMERMEAIKQHYLVQVFATDINSSAIATARRGTYPASIAADVSPERLARFFTKDSDGSSYRIRQGIRDMVIFSEQDVIKDPPFSKLDLISCRNVLIYLGSELQKKIIPLFHYALRPGGVLFLDTSSVVGEFTDLFAVLDRKSKLFQRRENFRPTHARFRTALTVLETPVSQPTERSIISMKRPLRELTEQALLQQVIPAAALVNGQGDILYLHGRTGMYLEPTPGVVGIDNILKMAREGLRLELTTGLHKAAQTKEVVYYRGLRIKTNGHFTMVDLTICPTKADLTVSSNPPLYLVILEECNTAEREHLPQRSLSRIPEADEPNVDVATRIAALKHEVQDKEEYLQATNLELQASNEELKSSSEEMQSMNEELQSSNEELETSSEELQSVNEELATVNAELQSKMADLARTNNDMNNLLAGTGIATIFIDRQLCILRFTPTATRIIPLISADMGRPIADFASNLIDHDNLTSDAQTVLNTLVPQEVEVQTKVGRWYTMHIQAYRTVENLIEGAVITFVDITVLKLARDALRKANDQLRLAIVVRDSRDAITVQDLDGRILAWNPCAVRMYGWTEAEALDMNVRERIPESLRHESLAQVHQLSQAEILVPYRTQRISKGGSIVEVSIISTALVNEAGQMYAIATTERAIKTNLAPIREEHHGQP